MTTWHTWLQWKELDESTLSNASLAHPHLKQRRSSLAANYITIATATAVRREVLPPSARNPQLHRRQDHRRSSISHAGGTIIPC
eukprot:3728834-Pleurochrysis_carterae.AAC.1